MDDDLLTETVKILFFLLIAVSSLSGSTGLAFNAIRADRVYQQGEDLKATLLTHIANRTMTSEEAEEVQAYLGEYVTDAVSVWYKDSIDKELGYAHGYMSATVDRCDPLCFSKPLSVVYTEIEIAQREANPYGCTEASIAALFCATGLTGLFWYVPSAMRRKRRLRELEPDDVIEVKVYQGPTTPEAPPRKQVLEFRRK
jgi:hypothetical protein